MTHLELLILNYLLNSLWQVPAIFLAATLAARLARHAGPLIEHRIWVSALALETGLPACAFAPGLRSLLLSLIHLRSGFVTTQTTILNAAPGHGSSHLPGIFASTALAAYAIALLYFTARLLYRLHRTRALRRATKPLILTGELLTAYLRCSRIFQMHGAQIVASTQITGPSTIGIRRRIVLLPPALLAELPHEDLTAALAHEFAHLRRRDFAKNLVYELIALPIAWHPLLWLTRLRIAASREMVCDEIAAHATHGAARYAHSLLRLAAFFSRSTPAATVHAIGILDANVLDRRVMTLIRKRTIAASSRRTAIAAAVVLGVATCASAMSLRLEIPARSIIASGAQQTSGPIKVSGGVAAGNILSKVAPIYPAEAKAKGIQGTVVLNAIIGKDGTVQDLEVISGPEELQPSALEAVKQWVYKPYLLNGEPVEVKTTITVNYALGK